MLFRELAQVEGGWLGHNDMIGNRLEHGLGYFGRLVLEKAKGIMESIADGGRGHCMVWLTTLGAGCCGGCLESCSIFLLDSKNMGQSFVPISLPLNMQYGG
jgi:hypothetical protein